MAVGVRQVLQLCQDCAADLSHSLHVVIGSGRYGTAPFLGPLRSSGCAQRVRLRRDRVL